MTQVSCVSFPGARGIRLGGILHEPDPATARNVCVLLLSPGIKGRVGPHRLYVKIAARLVPMGFHVLRFDFHGLGDSEGHLTESALSDVYASIQSGRYVQDTIAAMDWVGNQRGINRFVASGLCGGSLTGLLTAAEDTRIRSVLALGIPVILDGDPQQRERHLTKGHLRMLRRGYLQRLGRPDAWIRLATGRSSYRVIWKSLRRKTSSVGHAATDSEVRDNANPRFAPAFISVVGSGRPILLIFSGADRLRWEFHEKFVERNSRQLEHFRQLFEVHIIENANHVLSDTSWIEQMLAVSTQWLDTYHPARRIVTA